MTVLSAKLCHATVTIVEYDCYSGPEGRELLERYNAYVERFLPDRANKPIVYEVFQLLASTTQYSAPRPVEHKFVSGILVHVREPDGREYMQRVDAT